TSKATRVVVATDHEEIFTVCKQHNLDVIMTSTEHQSGTDRIAEVVQQLSLAEDEIIVNVQGDEPLIDPELINQLANFIAAKRLFSSRYCVNDSWYAASTFASS
ncbi:MAG: hypothetical protein EBS25_05665, partial [Actinobacteria bacterium]|nr:hypothetical protein [Actinomycetota bacterium]